MELCAPVRMPSLKKTLVKAVLLLQVRLELSFATTRSIALPSKDVLFQLSISKCLMMDWIIVSFIQEGRNPSVREEFTMFATQSTITLLAAFISHAGQGSNKKVIGL